MLPGIEIFEQPVQAGTGDAVLAARAALERHRGDVLVMFADTPLVEAATLRKLIARWTPARMSLCWHSSPPTQPATAGSSPMPPAASRPSASTRMPATPSAISACAPPAPWRFAFRDVAGLLSRIGNANARGEYYLTDAVAIAAGEGLIAKPVLCSVDEATGVNSREQLAAAEAMFQARARRKAMEDGATLIAPETVWFSFDTIIGRDVTIEPNVFFGPGVVVEDGAQILANCHMTGTRIRKGARVGPFARFRPGADIGPGAHIGNFVEVKNATVEAGAKANHLSYIGDGRVGEGANIGAGTIFCNYDGFTKHFTDIGKGAFVGSNTSLVAPVKVGEGAYIGSGSVITKDVAPGALALERSAQEERPGWAAKFKLLMQKRKKTA